MTIFGTDALVLSSNTALPWETTSRWKDEQGPASYYKSQYLDWSNDAAWISWLNGATDLSGQTGDISISYTPKYVSWNRNMGQSRGADSVIKTGYELEVNVSMPVLGVDWEEANSFWPNTTTQTHDEVSGTGATQRQYVIPQDYVEAVVLDGESYSDLNGWKISLMFAGRWYCDTVTLNNPIDGVLNYDIVMRPYMVEVRTQDFIQTT